MIYHFILIIGVINPQSMLFTLVPPALEPPAIRPGIIAVALSSIILKLPFVYIALRPFHDSYPIHLVLSKLPFIGLSISKCEFTPALHNSCNPLTRIAALWLTIVV